MDAVVACSEKADAQFAALNDIPDMEDENLGDDLRVDANGAFVWSATMTGKGRPLPERLVCQGNLNERTINSIEFNGVIKRPAAQEVWKF